MKIGTWLFTGEERKLVLSIIAKGVAEQERNERFAVIDFDHFFKLFTPEEVAVMQKYLAIDPRTLDYKLPYLGFEDTPSDLVAIPDQTYSENDQTETIPCQYLPKPSYDAYTRLNQAMNQELGNSLEVLYGYRSPARQVFMFFHILQANYEFDFDKAIRRVCFPAYSEHVCIVQQAIDFITQNGICEDFDKTEEYRWLQKNAARFGFFESYPRDNDLEMSYEPWHWHYEQRRDET